VYFGEGHQMGYGHPLALRSRIIDAVMAGAVAREAARRFAGEGVDISRQAINTALRALGYGYKKIHACSGARAPRRGA
jgi:hypothetical protein